MYFKYYEAEKFVENDCIWTNAFQTFFPVYMRLD